MKNILTYLLCFLTSIAIAQPENIDALYKQGVAAYQKGDKQIAANLFNKICLLDTTEIPAIEYLVIVYSDLKRYDSAVLNAVKLCVKFPEKDEVHSGASFYYTLLNKPKAAEAYGKKAVKLNDRQYNNMLNLGHACLLQNKDKEAYYWYVKALEWVNSEAEFERAFLGDFKMIDSLQLVDSAVLNSFVLALKAEFADINTKSKASILLDSIKSYDNIKLSSGDRKKVIDWKKMFIDEELKQPIKRLSIMAAFYTDIGLYKYGVERNRTVALKDYLVFATVIYKNEKDSLSLTQFYIDMSHNLLFYSKNDNKYLKPIDAYDYAIEAKKILDTYGLKELKTNVLSQLAEVCLQNERNEEAILYLHQLLDWGKKTNDGIAIFEAANKLSVYYDNKKMSDSALYYDLMAMSKINFAGLSRTQILQMEENSLLIKLKSGYSNLLIIAEATRLKQTLKSYDNDTYSDLCEIIAQAYKNLKSTDSAYAYYKQAVESYMRYSKYREKQTQKNVVPFISDKRQFSFWNLAEIAAERKDFTDLFYWIEKMKDNNLRFFISNQFQPEYVTPLDTARNLLPDNAAAITFTGADREKSPAMAFTKDKQAITWLDQHQVLDGIRKNRLNNSFKQMELLMQKSAKSLKDSIEKAMQLAIMQFYYLSNINPNASRGVVTLKRADEHVTKELQEEKNRLSRFLYDLYIKPFEQIIKGKKTLYISADLIQHFIPFETLLMPDGRYLAEAYDIIYTPGFTIYDYLKKRTYNKGSSIIAVGNPDYSTYKPEKLNGRALDFTNYGITSWDDLPGTKQELDMLQSSFDSVTVITQSNLTETKLKKLSQQEKLKDAAILHFALHGMGGVATAKEDNSLVVSEPIGGTEDGLLQFFEAADLYIQPRLVCLSACETGLGMIGKDGSFSTMGTAFLVAGAKAVLVTNWKIDDAATALFMKDVYRQIKTGAIDFPEAIGNTKRKFIKGDFGETYKKPYYWAPFKYFGN